MTLANEQKTTDIKYIYLEMIHVVGEKHDVVAGLFKGMIEFNGETLVLLQGLSNCINVVNLRFYNFMTIEVLGAEYKDMIFLTREEQDQESALKIVKAKFQELRDAGYAMVNDGNVIATNRYVDVPAEYLNGKEITSGAAKQAGGVGAFAGTQTRYTPNQYNKQNFTKTPVKKDPGPTAFGRTKTKRPTKDTLALMVEKIEAIKAGDAEVTLPELTVEKEIYVDKAATTAAAYEDEDYYSNIYGAHGAMGMG